VKKFIALGVAALSAATFVLGAAPAAHADEEDPIIPGVCLDLPNTIIGSVAVLQQALNSAATADAAVADTRSDLNAAVASFVLAFANHLKALDGVAGVASVTQAALDAASSDVADAAAAWGQAKLDQWTAHHNLDVATVANDMNGILNGALCL
jgi:hypothetical protein